MNKITTLSILGLSSFSASFAQETNFRSQMEELELKKTETNYFKNFQNNTSDFISLKRAKAWNPELASTNFFSNTKDLNIDGIGGRVRASLVDVDNNIALVAPSGGGVWTFDTATGTDFEPINDLGSFLAVTDITQNPFQAKEILIATGDEQHNIQGNGLFRSLDGGKSFTPINSTSPLTNDEFKEIRFIKYSPTHRNTLYLVTYSKIFKSLDNGESWNEVFTSLYNEGNYIYTNKISSIDFLKNGFPIISVNNKGLYRVNSNNSDEFVKIENGLPSNEDEFVAVEVATYDANPDIAYTIAVEYRSYQQGSNKEAKLFKTTDGGDTWNKVNWIKNPEHPAPIYISQSTFSLEIEVHPTNPDIVIIGSVGIGYSVDGGVNWTSAKGFEVDYHSIEFAKGNDNLAYIGYDQGIGVLDFSQTATYYDYNLNKNVEQYKQDEIGKQADFNTTQINFGDYFPKQYGDSYVEGQQDGGCFISLQKTDKLIEGRIKVGDGSSVFIDKQDPNHILVSTQYGNIEQINTALGGQFYNAFKKVKYTGDHNQFVTYFQGNTADGSQVFIPTSTSVQRSLDGGSSFTSLAESSFKFTTNFSSAIAVENDENPTVYVTQSAFLRTDYKRHTNLIKIADASSNSPKEQLFENVVEDYIDRITVAPNDVNKVYITTSQGDALSITGLEGENSVSSSIRGNLSDVVFNIVLEIPSENGFLIAGTNVGVVYSEDNGTTWVLSNHFPYTQITDLKYRNSDNRLFVFTYGRGAWASTLGTNTVGVSNKFDSNNTIKVFPVPVINTLNIEEYSNDIELILYDVLGHEIIKEKNKTQLDLSSLKAGNYILHFKNSKGELIQTTKIIKQ